MELTAASGLAQLTSDGVALQPKSGSIRLTDVLPEPIPPARGLYVHVPFCTHKCHYCDFYSIVDGRDRRVAFTERLIRELAAVGGLVRSPIETVFAGGGTPTLLEPAQWSSLLVELRRLPLREDAEVTVEANPETVSPELADTLAAGGVNRVSIGCQSFDQRHLATLERWHDPASVPRAVDRLRRAGIGRLNLDLIFGIPGQQPEDWQRDLETVLELEPDHVSCYALTYEPNTPLTMRMRAGRITPVDDGDELHMYELAIERLARAGFEHYEVSAWARPGSRCRHNLLYWRNENWWAVGPSAAGHLAGLRWRNVPRLGAYLDDGPWPRLVDVEAPDDDRLAGESFMMGLRLLEGMPRARVEQLLRLGRDAEARAAALRTSIERGDLEWHADHLRLTRQGLPIADTVVSELL